MILREVLFSGWDLILGDRAQNWFWISGLERSSWGPSRGGIEDRGPVGLQSGSASVWSGAGSGGWTQMGSWIGVRLAPRL